MRVRPPLARTIRSSSDSESVSRTSTADAKSFAEEARGPNCASKSDGGPSESDIQFRFSPRLIC